MIDTAQHRRPQGFTTEDLDALSMRYMLRGAERLTATELRALGEHTGTGNSLIGEGYYLASTSFVKDVEQKIRAFNPIRANGAKVFKNVGYSLTIPVVEIGVTPTALVRAPTTGALAIAAGEQSPTFSLPSINNTSPTGGVKLFPKPRSVWVTVSRELLEDTTEDNGANVEKVLAEMIAHEFAGLETKETFTGSATSSTETNATHIGLAAQLNAAVRVNSVAFGTTAASVTALELTQIIAQLSSGRFMRALWIMHPQAAGCIDTAGGDWLATARPRNDLPPCLHLAGRPLYLEPAVSASFATGIQGFLIDPTAFVYAESGQTAIRRLDEIKAATGQVVFEAIRRYDFILADTSAGYAIKL